MLQNRQFFVTFVVATLRLKECPASDRGKKEEKYEHQNCWDQGYAHQLGAGKKSIRSNNQPA